MIYKNIDELKQKSGEALNIKKNSMAILDEKAVKETLIDDLVYSAVLSDSADVRKGASWLIRRIGASMGIFSSSIYPLYEAVGQGKISGFTVPAINLRGITYASAQAVFRSAMAKNAGAIIFEIARSEIGYTNQRPREYTAVITAAAIKTGFRGPIFLQGDHFQINAKKYGTDPEAEKKAVAELVKEAVEEGFYNIDIDASTVVDLSQPTLEKQQENNFRITADMTALIREIEPHGITVSIGGEIGEVGTKNTTPEEFVAFMEGYRKALLDHGGRLAGISKISIQTGTSHGGVPLPDGTVADVNIDFDALREISRLAREEYGLAGAVQHGASTLPEEAFDKFPEVGTAEVHLATGFQNIIYDSDHFPPELKNRIYNYLKDELKSEKKASDTEEQFIYKTRKKGFGPFKYEMWNLKPELLDAISSELEKQFCLLFDKLKINETQEAVNRFITPIDIPVPVPDLFG
ncbi:MAG: class II fructose-bisphosphate aldolase [Syntrophales bacterium]|jgi:fructose/tagatose bisphosphate aldolase|nr:class II fructose-bisphosphate aldolase [Syntrophales bacterium]MDY0044852.1 class II fructose-bisphosphate aldolase [Syntrophales bacterium]